MGAVSTDSSVGDCCCDSNDNRKITNTNNTNFDSLPQYNNTPNWGNSDEQPVLSIDGEIIDLHSTSPGSGDAIFSLSGNYKATGKKYTKDIYVETSPNNYHRLDSFKLNTDNLVSILGPDKNQANRNLIDKIITYYARKIGISADIVIDSESYSKPEALAYFSPVDGKIHIAIHENGTIDSLLNNFNNLMSVLYHENLHLKDKQDGKTVTYRSHAEVYMNQILKGPNFSKTTYDFQKGQIGAFAAYLDNAINRGENVDDLIKTFNEQSVDWKVTGHYTYGPGNLVYYKGEAMYLQSLLLSTPN
ncbi:hypothetical protein GCM10011518_44690 [Flavobacterium limi]|uniref:Tox-MPTase2 domain-containing protein n=2 Tax=Flavobacterium limi TaxID=2045105 RepID=A0ABQ1UYP7_9FLAO|nr:hypothetical protein GCM10011518_44690 [Flavobacterium limi]